MIFLIEKYKKVQFAISDKIHSTLFRLSGKEINKFCKRIILNHITSLDYPPMSKIPTTDIIWFYQTLQNDKIKEIVNITVKNIKYFLFSYASYEYPKSLHDHIFFLIDYLEYLSHTSVILDSISKNEKIFTWTHQKNISYSVVWAVAIKKIFDDDKTVKLRMKVDKNRIIFNFVFLEKS